jgi:hypothetical protein
MYDAIVIGARCAAAVPVVMRPRRGWRFVVVPLQQRLSSASLSQQSLALLRCGFVGCRCGPRKGPSTKRKRTLMPKGAQEGVRLRVLGRRDLRKKGKTL